MQKPPEIRRLAKFLGARILEQDGRDDQDLGGDGNHAGRRRFDDTHFNFLGSAGAVSLRQRLCQPERQFSTAKVDIVSCKICNCFFRRRRPASRSDDGARRAEVM